MPAEQPTTADAPFGMTDLEERLRADDGGIIRAALLSRMAQMEAAIGAIVGRGLAPDEFRRAQAIQDAVAAARAFLAHHR